MAPIAVPTHREVAALSAPRKTRSTSSVLSEAAPVMANAQEQRAHVRERLALAIRIFGRLGYDEGVAGHITWVVYQLIEPQKSIVISSVRDPVDHSCFWVNPFGIHFSLVQAEDLLLVSHTGQVLPAGGNGLLNKAAFMIHSAVHAARPDVMCAAHSHSVYGRAFATFGRPLDITSRESCAFYNDHAVHTEYKGVVLDEIEGIHIAESLGLKKAAILKNHGLLVATGSIEATVFFYKALEEVCRVQIMADAGAGGVAPKTIPHDEAVRLWKAVGSQEYGHLHGLAEFQAAATAKSTRRMPA